MKTRDIIIVLGSLAFSFLYFPHSHGINHAVFSAFLITSLAVTQPSALLKVNWWLCVAAVFISALSMSLYGNMLSFFSLFFSWMLLSAYTFKPYHSAILNFTQAGFSFLIALPVGIKGWYYQSARKLNKGRFNAGLIPAYLVVITPVLFFIVLYSQASTAFSSVLKNIDFSFVSFGRVVTLIIGFVLCVVLIYHKRIKSVDRIEKNWGSPLVASLSKPAEEVENELHLERKSGRLLLLLLNAVLLAVNTSDIVFLSSLNENALQRNYPEIVHQGIGALIISIISAVAVLLFFFRGQLNFDKKAKPLYYLAIFWVAQNLVLVLTAGYKNTAYIDIAGGLTYKRIGVYYYLLLSFIGLVFTAYKLYAKKSNWYLVRINFAVFFAILVVSTPINWDNIVTRYNLTKAQQEHKDPDLHYMSRLGYHNLPLLVEWAKEASRNPESVKKYTPEQVIQICDKLYIKSHRFERIYKAREWQSWTFCDKKTYEYLSTVNWDEINTTQPKFR
jgi:hypothetical protein